MDDLSCGSERALEVIDGASFANMEGTALLEKALTPDGQTLCSLEATAKQAENVDFSETELDMSGSTSLGTKKCKGDDGVEDIVSHGRDPRESSAYEHSLSFPLTFKLISAMKGGREKNGEASPTENRRVKWAPDVYDPPVTSVSHSVKSNQQRPKSRRKDKNKQKQKQKGRLSRENGSGKKNCHNAVQNLPALQPPGSTLDKFGEHESEILDYGISCEEAKCGSCFLHETVAQMHFSIAEAS